ncbi:MAG: EAL domain-containing protein [Lachnospiraceae bacterium]|nr:EAL domain-containing protein [Lachnospiraceae bacterium]
MNEGRQAFSEMNTGLVYTNENCVGCNKCIASCSCVGACVSTEADESGRSKIIVDPSRCISCGACFDACEHNAREYLDDTAAFFDDLKKGVKISLLIAPAFKANYPDEYARVLGILKKLGVSRMISVSFGADITTWGYIKYIQERGFYGGISQPCPAVVSYIEKYHPELIPKLFPVQSPLMCAAIYARKEMGVTDRLAFISPCIAKKLEIDDPNNHGYVSYNVTFSHLMKYIESLGIEADPVTDEVEYGLGSFYPTPGGLMENVKWLIGEDVFIREIGGEKHLYNYLREKAGQIAKGDTPFLLYDALNCENGCICGTAVDPLVADADRAFSNLLTIRESVKKDTDSAWARNLTPAQRLKLLNEQFSSLDLSDYLREYTDLSETCENFIPTPEELEPVYHSMRKDTEESRKINCSSCGYETCHEMACAIYNGFNHRDNCVYYLKREVEDEKEHLLYQATHDDVLEIWNRRSAVSLLRDMMDGNTEFSVMIADIDGFKNVNATYGHSIADQFLKILTGRLKETVESQGVQIVRYGGDVFMFLIPGENVGPDSRIVADIQKAFTDPIHIGHNHLSMNVSIGISQADRIADAEEHIINAEAAVSEAKQRERNKIFLYAEELKEKAREEKWISERIKEALDNDGFLILYQPQIDSRTEETSGYEALVRMKEPELYPSKFIPVAERNGWIWRIGRITTELVIKQIAKWKEEGFELHPVSINFSSNQLSDSGYIDFLESTLKKYGVSPEYIEIEITEGVFLDRTAQANDLFDRFKRLGIRLLMDDFGTGYSSLGYLTYIPVDIIKLDKSLVDNYLVDGKDSFIDNVIHLIHDLGKKMIVEGVEEKRQFDRLRDFGADTIQGFYFSKPIPPDEAICFRVRQIGDNK